MFQELLINSLAFLGLLYLLIIIFPLFKICLVSAFRSLKTIKKTYGNKESYVVVTGATDGIGFGFCQAFAKIGFNIILISRNAKKLDTCSKILAGKYAISTICIEANFLNSLEEDFFKDIYEKIKHLDIAILVNNVGTALGSDFLSHDDQKYFDLLKINCFPIVFMTKILLPLMLKREKKSAIINLSSITGQYPQGYAAVYSATKAFGDFFSQALGVEITMNKQKIDLLSVRPCAVSTPLTRNVKNYGAIKPIECAQGSLKYLGFSPYTNGHFLHNFQAWSAGLVPERFFKFIFAKESKRFYDTWETLDKKKQ